MDYFNFLSCSKFPAMTAEIDTWSAVPDVVKPPKETTPGTLAEIAVRSMSNSVGLITWVIAKCNALGNLESIPRLGQELQLEVDGFKTSSGADMDWVMSVADGMKKVKVAWLTDKKKKEAFIIRPLAVGNRNDTISRIASVVSGIWQQSSLTPLPLSTFSQFLGAATKWRGWAIRERDEYRAAIASVTADNGETRLEQDKTASNVSQVVLRYRTSAADIPAAERADKAVAMWHACHLGNGKASLAFIMFAREISDRLSHTDTKFTIVGGDKNAFAGFSWNGECYTVQVVDSEHMPGKQEVYIDDYLLGFTSSNSIRFESGCLVDISLRNYKKSIMAEVVA